LQELCLYCSYNKQKLDTISAQFYAYGTHNSTVVINKNKEK
jgi:hypothetical protein